MTNPKPLDWSGNLRARNRVTNKCVEVTAGRLVERHMASALWTIDPPLNDRWVTFNVDGTHPDRVCPWIIEQADEPATEEASEGAGVDIAGLRELLAKATEGPWRLTDQYIDGATRPPPIASAHHEHATAPGGSMNEEATANAALIVAMRNALPTLLDKLSPDPRDALIAEAKHRLRLTEGCQEANVDDERFWQRVIEFLEEKSWSTAATTAGAHTITAGATTDALIAEMRGAVRSAVKQALVKHRQTGESEEVIARDATTIAIATLTRAKEQANG